MKCNPSYHWLRRTCYEPSYIGVKLFNFIFTHLHVLSYENFQRRIKQLMEKNALYGIEELLEFNFII